MNGLDLLGADHENGSAVVNKTVEQPEYFSLGTDVDSARRLIENEEPRICIQPFANDDFLLVAAGQSSDRSSGCRRGNSQLVDDGAGSLHCPPWHEQPRREQFAQSDQDDVVAYRTINRETLGLAVLRDQRHAAAH